MRSDVLADEQKHKVVSCEDVPKAVIALSCDAAEFEPDKQAAWGKALKHDRDE